MYFKYGACQHDDGEVNLVSLSKIAVANERGETTAMRWKMQIEGVLVAASQAAIRTKLEAVEAAYAVNGRDAGLYHDDGTPSPHVLDSSAATGGVRVTAFEFNQSHGAEYATQRTFTATLEAEFAETSVVLSAWHETLNFTGSGGPRSAYIEVLTGLPQKQIVNRATVQRSVQSGKAIGCRAYPTASPPIWPAAERGDLREIETGSPQYRGGTLLDFPIAWKYTFESARHLTGRPRVR